jgi:replicative superfamily II helicase
VLRSLYVDLLNINLFQRLILNQNIKVLAVWLDAKFYESKYRPVPIEEYIVFENAIYSATTSSAFFKTASQLNHTDHKIATPPRRLILPSSHKELQKPEMNAVVSLATETVKAGYGALVFCRSRQGCQTDALLISEAMPPASEVDMNILDRRKQVLTELRSLPVGLDSSLEKTIPRGVAFHRRQT